MKRQTSVRSLFLQNAMRAAIMAADTVRRAGAVALLCAGLLSIGAVYMARVTFANSSLWQSWTRLFGHPVPRPASDPGMQPESATGDDSNPGYTLTSFDAPGAGTTELEGTFATGINASGTITGIYSNAMGVTHGFIRTADGTFTAFDSPSAGSTSPGIEGTIPISINSNGDVTGICIDSSHAYHGFVRLASDGTVTEFDAPGAGSAANRGTSPLSINDAGEIAGLYTTGGAGVGSSYYGFLRAANGTITTVSEPNAGSGEDGEGDKQGTEAVAINASGEIVGDYYDSKNNLHGFVLSTGGAYTSFDPPGSTTTNPSEPTGTIPTSIDAAGDVAGTYTDSNSLRHGFVRTASGTITSFDAPGAVTTSGSSVIGGTAPLSIDPGGNYIAGIYTDSGGMGHGFIYSQPLSGSGTFTTFEATGASAVTGAPLSGTMGFSINASGMLSGSYSDSSGVLHGLVLALTGPAATPTFSPAAGTYSSAQTVTISDTTPEATIYYTTDGTAPTTSSTVYSSPISVSSTETIEAIATASGYANSAVASAAYTINLTSNPTPALSSISPPFVAEGSAGFTLTANGSGFVSNSALYWGSTALTTTYGSATQLTAPVTAAEVAAAGITSVTVQTPAPGGGTSNALQFEVDSATSGSVTPPDFTTVTATVAPGSTASYPVTLPSSATNVTVSCLNLPAGAACSYSASAGAVSITTSATTPAGTYVITVVFTETLPGASAAWLLFPLLLLPVAAARRRWRAGRIGFMVCLALIFILTMAVGGCGGGSSSSSTPPPQTHQVTSSGTVTLTVQ
jgi:hypothetical protein